MDALGRLAGGVAHDFNNLLTVIRGHSELLLDGLQPGDALYRNSEQIRKTSDRAASLTRQMLAFSRMQVLQPKVLDLNELIVEMGKLLRRLVREDIEFSLWLGDSLSRVKADPGQIEQVLLNLTVNASDAMPLGGKLTIETQNVIVDTAYAANATVRCARIVRDDWRFGYGTRHGRSHEGANLRAVLYDEGAGKRNGAGAGNGLRSCEAEQRIHLGGVEPGQWIEV